MLHNLANKKIALADTGETVGTGWLPPTADPRDYTTQTPIIAKMAQRQRIKLDGAPKGLPPKMDLRPWCSDVVNQGQLGSCTANAASGIVEYCEVRATQHHINASRLFIYKVTRDLMGVVGDTGAWLRQTAGALALCGVPPEDYWPYTDATEPGAGQERYFDVEPPAFIYSLAGDHKATQYFRHDASPSGSPQPTPAQVLNSVKTYLAAYTPSMFGFFGFASFNNTSMKGGIPMPCPGETAAWGHAICAVGYDDGLKITNTKCNVTTTGALLIRNSWGTGWGDKGYGWLPYDYVLKGHALDFWSILKLDWIETGQFELPVH
jgi:C1A family cysteine protease